MNGNNPVSICSNCSGSREQRFCPGCGRKIFDNHVDGHENHGNHADDFSLKALIEMALGDAEVTLEN